MYIQLLVSYEQDNTYHVSCFIIMVINRYTNINLATKTLLAVEDNKYINL